MPNKPSRFNLIKSHYILHDIVYFTTVEETIFSFLLKAQTWCQTIDPFGVISSDPLSLRTYFPPTFDTQIQLIGKTIFGGFLHPWAGYLDICASPSLDPSDAYFLRPTLAHDFSFFTNLYSEPKKRDLSISWCSNFLVTLDEGKGIICVVSYGKDSWDDYVNFATLNFFEVTDGSYRLPISFDDVPQAATFHRRFVYANDSDLKHTNFFNATFIATTILPINTTARNTTGNILSCFFV